MNKIKVYTICGPTASGKSALGVEIAKRINGEIISADSIQIYKYVDIASAKPSKEEMQGIKHHLIDYVEPDENYSVSRFVDDANKCIDDIISRNKTPIIVGGTGLYIDTLINNIKLLDNSFCEEVRKELQERLQKEGIEKLYEQLQKIDFEASKKIHPNNAVKILRALEIYYSSGKTLTEQNEQSLSEGSRFDNTSICLIAKNREFLYERINKRVDLMLQKGLLEEAERFFKMNFGNTSSQAIGYKELKPYFDNELSLEECVENLKKATRHYAKRQMTWFRRNKNNIYFYIDSYNDVNLLTDDVMKYIF